MPNRSSEAVQTIVPGQTAMGGTLAQRRRRTVAKKIKELQHCAGVAITLDGLSLCTLVQNPQNISSFCILRGHIVLQRAWFLVHTCRAGISVDGSCGWFRLRSIKPKPVIWEMAVLASKSNTQNVRPFCILRPYFSTARLFHHPSY